MAEIKKPKPRRMDAAPALQLTSGQLVLTVVVLIVAGAALIVLGVLLGRWESSWRETQTAAGPAPEPMPATSQSGRQVSPNPEVLPEPPRRSRQTGSVETRPDLVEIPAPPAPSTEETSPTAEATPDSVDEAGPGDDLAVAEEAAPAPDAADEGTADEPEETEREAPVDQEPDMSGEDVAEEEGPAPTETEEAEPAEAATFYSVQVAAFSVHSKGQVDQFLEENASMGDDIETASDDEYVRVYIGRFPDRGVAEAKRDELKKLPAFGGCFVKARTDRKENE